MNANKVFCGDARRLLASLADESIDAVISDPMYGTSKNCRYDWGLDPALGNPEKHWAYHQPIYDECRRVLKPGGVLAWAQSAKFCGHFGEWFGDHRIWTLTRFRTKGKNATGHVWVVQTKERLPVRFPDRDALVVYDAVGPLRKLHPCIKMVEELEFIVEALTDPGQIVFDCCCGLGSTLIAAQRLGRQWIGCDLSPTYCQIALRRLALAEPRCTATKRGTDPRSTDPASHESLLAHRRRAHAECPAQ
jgi:DNA modification methylase